MSVDKDFKLTLCICTYNRNEGLLKLLKSINNSKFPSEIKDDDIRLVIIDNYMGESEEVVKHLLDEFRFEIAWYFEQKKGLTFARNKSVELAKNTEYCFFVDDDQILDENCLFELLKTAETNNAGLVYGSNPPLFEKKPSNAISNYFYLNSSRKAAKKQDYVIKVAPTNCTLVKKTILNEVLGPFNLVFNLTGGEDSYLTRQLYFNGAHMIKSVNAKAYEVIPENRCTLKWITKRAFRGSTSIAIQDKMFQLGYVFYFKRISKAIIKICFGIIFLIPSICMPSYFSLRYKAWIHFVQGLGHIFGYLNVHPKEYDNLI